MISVLVTAILLVVLCPEQAWAIPAPMSPERLLSASDVVALVRVLSVTCVALGERKGEVLRHCHARLGLLQVRKGQYRKFDTLTVFWNQTPRDVLGPWYVPYGPGEKAWTHLRLPQRSSAFETTWWNAKDLIEPARAPMPTGVMQTIKAPFLDRLPFVIADTLRLKHWRLPEN